MEERGSEKIYLSVCRTNDTVGGKNVFKKISHTHTHTPTPPTPQVLEHIYGLLTSGLNWKYIPFIDSGPLKVLSSGTGLF